MSEIEGGGSAEEQAEADLSRRSEDEGQAEAEKFNAMVDDGKLTPAEASQIEKDKTPEEVEKKYQRRERRQKLLATGIDQKARNQDYIGQKARNLKKQTERGEQTDYEPLVGCKYSEYCHEFPEGSRKFTNHVDKYPLVDLGSGSFGAFYLRRLHDLKNIKILVDEYNSPKDNYVNPPSELKDLREPIGNDIINLPRPKINNIEEIGNNTYYSRSDMLVFLSQLPDSYCNITMNNIDGFVINDREYFSLLASQIERVLPDDGIFMCCSSEIIYSFLLERGFIDVTDQMILDDHGNPIERGFRGVRIFRKPVDLIQEERQQDESK